MADDDRDAKTVLAEAMFADPRTRPMILRAGRVLNPKADIPELDVLELRDQLRGTLEETKAVTEQAKKRNERAEWDDAWHAAVERGLAKDDERETVHEYMRTNHVGSYDAALKAMRYEQRQTAQVAAPRSGPTPMRMPGTTDDKYYAGLIEDRDRWANERAYEALDDIMRRRGTPQAVGSV